MTAYDVEFRNVSMHVGNFVVAERLARPRRASR